MTQTTRDLIFTADTMLMTAAVIETRLRKIGQARSANLLKIALDDYRKFRRKYVARI